MNLSYFDLSGKNALITGGTHGLGFAIAEGLGDAGATLIINGNSSREKLNRALDRLLEKGYRCYGYKFDVTNEEDVNSNIISIEEEVGEINILINNAGIIDRNELVTTEVDKFTEILNVNLVGAFIVSKCVARQMIARRAGKIINICSLMSELGRDTVGAYAASKGGLKMLTKNMATEWARFNIQVNGIGPGYFETSQTAPIRVKGHPFNEFIINRTPARRWGQPSDLAGGAIFLSSSASNFINGHILYIDGGILCTIGRPLMQY